MNDLWENDLKQNKKQNKTIPSPIPVIASSWLAFNPPRNGIIEQSTIAFKPTLLHLDTSHASMRLVNSVTQSSSIKDRPCASEPLNRIDDADSDSRVNSA
ncbi:hypothetical protein KQX54_008706 [Cotesia glomerata]|uniref:Uncharacterized protein n=1 Tax=Cotesia glomerata TaxID=32391 RepID=A0AAV7ILV3_COTGL|nr:hypothetical protein KQX54_008706 [Cotesia glomerata]